MYVTSPVKTVESGIVLDPDIFKASSDAGISQEMTYGPGENLFFDGDDATCVYEVLEGVVRSSKMLLDGRRQVLNFCYPGDIVGLSHDKLYHCDCDTVSEVRVRVYRKNACTKDIESDPTYCAILLRNAAAEVNNMQEHFLMLGRKTAMEKLASFLVAVMDRSASPSARDTRFDLPMMRCDIADFLGITIETVSRNLTKLREHGIIRMPTRHEIVVVDKRALRELAENTE